MYDNKRRGKGLIERKESSREERNRLKDAVSDDSL